MPRYSHLARVIEVLTVVGAARRPVFTAFGGTLNGVPVKESVGEGDWLYSTPIAPGTSVTLTKVFLGGSGDFALIVSIPHGVAFFPDQD